MLPNLDSTRSSDYTVLMKEQQVQYGEHLQNGIVSASEIPTPMVERAFRLLELLSGSEEGLTLSDLARALDMSKGSMHGLLKTLETSRAIERLEDRRYMLGPRIYDLAEAYLQHNGLRRISLPAMQRLASMTAETVCLGQIERQWVRILEHAEGRDESLSLHISAPRGTRVHLLAGATGRVILSSWSLAQQKTFLHVHPLPRFTERSITDPEKFLLAVEETSRTGIGVDYEEYLTGVNAVAAPIYGSAGTLLALLWIVGFASRFKDDQLTRAIEHLRAEAQAISQLLAERRA